VKITEELAVTDEKTELWNGYKLKKFLLNGCKCMIVEPEKALPGKPWIWRARFWGAWPYVDLALLKKGCHVAYIDVSNLYGSPKATRRFDMFYKYLTEKLGFLKKPVLEGYSRGGLIIYNWAARNPEKITCVYGDAPVCDFKSWPAKKSAVNWEKLKKVYGFENDAKALKYKGNPIDNLKPLAEAEVPIIHVAGDKDESVPIEENTNILAERYRKLGGNIKVIIKPGCGHHPHCLEDPEEIVDFILKSCKK
jgi:pimeloyl-ACP methyl ester carboxylesterase